MSFGSDSLKHDYKFECMKNVILKYYFCVVWIFQTQSAIKRTGKTTIDQQKW